MVVLFSSVVKLPWVHFVTPLSWRSRLHLRGKNRLFEISSLLLCPLQSLMLQIAANWIAEEEKNIAAAKVVYMSEHCPAPSLSGDQAALMVRNMFVSQQ